MQELCVNFHLFLPLEILMMGNQESKKVAFNDFCHQRLFQWLIPRNL